MKVKMGNELPAKQVSAQRKPAASQIKRVTEEAAELAAKSPPRPTTINEVECRIDALTLRWRIAEAIEAESKQAHGVGSVTIRLRLLSD